MSDGSLKVSLAELVGLGPAIEVKKAAKVAKRRATATVKDKYIGKLLIECQRLRTQLRAAGIEPLSLKNQNRATLNAWDRARRRMRREAGLCPECGKEKQADLYRCDRCQAKANERQNARRNAGKPLRHLCRKCQTTKTRTEICSKCRGHHALKAGQ